MKKKIELKGEKVSFIFRKTNRSRTMRLTVHCDGAVTASVPRHLSENTIENFILRKSAWIISKIAYFKKKIRLPNDRTNYLKNKAKASSLISERIKYFNQTYNFSFKKISVKNQKTRWGSCSRKKNLNFNYRILFLPGKIADYIVVHELCHLKEFNHSRDFWQEVGKTIPEYCQARKELKNFLN